jgi:hypothetical protein
MHVPDHLVVGEICYQAILQGYNATLVKDKKRAFIHYGFHVGFYMVKDITQAEQEGMSQLEFRFQIGRFHKHDPKGLVLKHASQVSSCWPYTHDKFEDEVFTENSQDWGEVVARMVDPKMTRFKAMSLDEQMTIIEKSTQGALRVREEMIVVESTEVPLVSLVQDIGFSMTQDAWERGLLMIKQAQWIIDQLQDDPDLTGMTGSPADNPDERQIGPSISKLIDIDEIAKLYNPEIIMP